ncbi:MAG: TIGR03619 family F420-dependent LLM class oxidoreductase [Thaumarchaeota archaeon]|nr:TIGR03619 family F420-dependent LLM class oxidoreductase [Nitrososphaerota archaeon]
MNLKIGIALPQIGRWASPEAIIRVAQGAEGMGLSSLWVLDRLLLPTNPMDLWPAVTSGGAWPDAYGVTFDPIETLTLAAAKTERIRLGTGIVDALYMPPILLGRRLATLDVMSGGRLVAGLSQGWSKDEFKATGASLSRRGRGFEEYLRVLRAIWGPDPVEFSGMFYTIPESRIGPKPTQSGGPPILSGGNSPAAFARAGRIADGLVIGGASIPSWEKFREIIDSFRSSAATNGRDPGALEVVSSVNRAISDRKLPEPRQPLSGDIEQMAEDLSVASSVGVNHVFFNMNFAQVPIETQLAFVEKLLDAV